MKEECPECGGKKILTVNGTCESCEEWIAGGRKLYPEEEEDFLAGVTCNPNAPEECESCQ